MKKILSFILAFVIISVCAAVNVSAVEEMGEVYVNYTPGSSASRVVSADISWGSLVFEYKDAIEGTWNPNTHQFDNYVAARWECDTNANAITVTNHSNANISVSLTYTNYAAFSGVTGTFDKPSFTLESAVGTSRNAAPSQTAYLTLSGAFAPSGTAYLNGYAVGAVTVIIR